MVRRSIIAIAVLMLLAYAVLHALGAGLFLTEPGAGKPNDQPIPTELLSQRAHVLRQFVLIGLL